MTVEAQEDVVANWLAHNGLSDVLTHKAPEFNEANLEALELTHLEKLRVQEWLEHHGIKGQRWGFRRERGPDGHVTSTIDKEASDPSKVAEGSGHGGGTRLSADAERALHTLKKEHAEMSTREMKEAVERARQIEAYNKLFNPNATGHQAIQAKVERLRLEKEYRNLKAELKSPSAVSKFIKAAASGFSVFQQLDKTLGGTLSNAISLQLGLKKISAADRIKAEVDLLRVQNDLIEQKRRSISGIAGLNRTTATDGPAARGDRPSQAPLRYVAAGKRNKGPGRHRRLD